MALALLSGPACADDGADRALRPELMVASDADGTEVWKAGMGWDWHRADREHWAGIDLQRARFSGEGWSHGEERLYGRAAGTLGSGDVDDDTWRWQVKLGTNGHTALGGATLHTEGPHRREVFFERELLETEAGVARRQIYNYLGAAIDQPFTARWSGTALAGAQTFGDGNLRTHLRGNLVYALVPAQGLSAQLRTRYHSNSDPYLGGYYSPSWYAEAIGVLGMRRAVGGHVWRGAAGFGRQRSADESWKRARLVELGYESPRWRQSWLRVSAGYTDTPVAASSGTARYSYRYLMLESVVAF
ncbi:hypothetical protein [Luteimonas deserti]|uniref:Alginate export domain-containing protein n=1 Tax=Luteimonas deserti TaxID=2752306 RepID=A0A7Z0U031_9GAMM|nr:hypothetical protein [Luteimonas deserti]NYZ64042.1 hypothetical protein [Luteimonas deserti]